MTLATPPRLPVRLDRTAAAPLPAQLADRVRALVLAGTLHAGDRLPSSRALAAELAVSRAVTAQAYEQLVAEGWLVLRFSWDQVMNHPERIRELVRRTVLRATCGYDVHLRTG